LSEDASGPGPSSGSINRWWRVVGTGISFACFGLGAVLLGFTIWPLLRLSSRRQGVARVQRAVSWSMRLFLRLMTTLGVISYEFRGLEKLKERGQFVVANHPSLIDVVLLVGYMPEVDCIVKQALWRNVFLRWPVSWAGYISNASGEGLIQACAKALREGRSLLVFPEGTRTRPGQPLSFQRGAAQIALAAGADFRPVTITCDPITLYKDNPWYRVPARRAHFILTVGETIRLGEIATPGEPAPLAARHVTAALARWFESSITAQLPGNATRNTAERLTRRDDSL
jgi:1-acyl-sn-glycerol-3-phosphate acyltransferase